MTIRIWRYHVSHMVEILKDACRKKTIVARTKWGEGLIPKYIQYIVNIRIKILS